MAQWGACLLSKCEAPSLDPQHPYPSTGKGVRTTWISGAHWPVSLTKTVVPSPMRDLVPQKYGGPYPVSRHITVWKKARKTSFVMIWSVNFVFIVSDKIDTVI